MRLLIDGYNLLHATDLFGDGVMAGTLRGSRDALIAFLATRLTPSERQATVIVFDAADAPPGLPDRFDHEQIDIRFARGYADADSMIEALLDSARQRRGLTVVSGDRRVQRAARSAGARWIDSREWFIELQRRDTGSEVGDMDSKGRVPVGKPGEWVAAFSDPSELERIAREADAAPLPVAKQPDHGASRPSKPVADPPAIKQEARPKPRKRRPPLDEHSNKPQQPFGKGVFDPFPPGYADDLLPGDDSSAKGRRDGQ